MEAFKKWHYTPPTQKFEATVADEDGKIICYAAKNSEQDRKNIKLCAAAPELLAFAQRYLYLQNLKSEDWKEATEGFKELTALAEAVIKQATD